VQLAKESYQIKILIIYILLKMIIENKIYKTIKNSLIQDYLVKNKCIKVNNFFLNKNNKIFLSYNKILFNKIFLIDNNKQKVCL